MEQWIPGAVARSLREVDIRALLAHDSTRPLARQSAGTLKLASDHKGLRARIQVPDTSYGRDLLEIVRTGAAPGWSFAFKALLDEWEFDGTNDVPIRTVLDARISEVSPGVVWPAYPATEAVRTDARRGRTAAGARDETRDAAARVAEFLRELSREHPRSAIRISTAYRDTGPKIRVLSVRPRAAPHRPALPLSLNRARQRQAAAA